MSCDAFRGLVPPYVDGELTGEDRAAFEAHLVDCEACQQVVDEEQAMVDVFRRSLKAHQAPAPLRQGIESLLAAPRARSRRLWALSVGAVAMGLAALAIAIWLPSFPAPSGRASPFAAVAAQTHLRYARGQLPLEVASEQPETITRWFEGRVPFQLRLPRYPVGPGERTSYHLEGGRLVSFHDRDAAYVAYRMEGQPISLLVASSETVLPEGGSIVTSGTLHFHIESVAGLKVITWTHQGLTYALVSKVEAEGAPSCVVCHGSADERRRIEGFPTGPGS